MRLFVECYEGRAFDKPQLLEIIEHAEAVVADADAREKGGANGRA